MAEISLECQGLPCPQPVLKCKTTIEEQRPRQIRVVVDNEAARQNVDRFLTSQGYDVTVTDGGDGTFVLNGMHAEFKNESDCTVCAAMEEDELAGISKPNKILVFLPAATVGSGDDTLGAKLMQAFLSTLPEMGKDLWRIVMVNSAVKLACSGSQGLDVLKQLDQAGVSILVCGTCLEFFNLTDAKQVGETTNMLDIVTSFQLADKVVRV